MKVEDQNEGYKDIPGLPEPDRGGKKGKKKNNSKKTLNLPIFTEANGKGLVSVPPVLSVEERPLKPQLNDKEVAILDSCHSYIHDYLKISGPMNAFDSRLQAEINLFPPEAKSVITRVGGLKAFILLCENLIVVDKIVGAKVHTSQIKDLALKDVYNSIPGPDKQIWNSTSPNSKVNKDQIALNKGHNSSESALQYHSTQQHFGNIGERGPPGPPPQNHIAASGSRTIHPEPSLQGYPPMESALEGLQKEVFKLNNQNKELISKLTEKDKQILELRHSEGRITQLELETDQARIQINKYREQIERLKSELSEAKTRAQSIIGQQPDKHKSYSDNDRDLIISLQKQLEAEKLRNLNLTQNQVDSQLPGLSLSGQHNSDNKQNVFAPMNNSLNRQNSFVNLGQGLVESDPLGLRNMSFSSGVVGGLELKSTPNLFGAIGSAFGAQQRAKGDSVMAPPGGVTHNQQLQAAPGGSLAAPGGSLAPPGSSSFNLMKSASASTINLAGSRGPSPSTNYQGFPSGLGGMPFSSFTSGQHPLIPGQGLMGGQPLPGTIQSLGLGGQSLLPGGQSLVPGGQSIGQPIASSVQSLVTGSQSLSVGNLSLGMAGVAQQSQWSGGLLDGSPGGLLDAPPGAPGLGGFLSQAPGLGSSLAPGGGHNSFGLSHLGSQQGVSGSGDLGQDSQPQKSNSAIRQEQLIKKLVNTIPGSNEDTIKHYIQVLRDRHGKLSGWSTNKITQEIIQLVQDSSRPI